MATTPVSRALRRQIRVALARSFASSPASWQQQKAFLAQGTWRQQPEHHYIPPRWLSSTPSPPPDRSRVINVKADSEFDTALSLAQENNGVAVAYFTAKWCAPCRTIAPAVDELSNKFPNVTFLKLDIDLPELQETMKASQVGAVPTFNFMKDGKIASQVVGADINQLTETLKHLQT